jgi:glycosyltransferase involved in cell wall biosynthesis
MFVVAPSACYENFPYSVLESFALGKPVVASNIGGIPEMVRDGETGFLVEPGDPARMAERMADLAGDRELVEKLGRNARSRVENEFSADIHYDKLMALYERVISRGDEQ